MFVAECDRICALQACMEDIQNNALDENIGHFDKEIDRADLEDLQGMKIDNITVRAETHSELIPAARKIEFESCK